MKNYTNFWYVCLFTYLCISPFVHAQQIGDPGWVFDESKYDPRIPAMKEWAKAGVQGGIPYRNSLPVKKTLTPTAQNQDRSGDLQKAIDEVARNGGGVVLLKKGTYPIRKKIVMKSKVVVRGEGKKNTILLNQMKLAAQKESVKTEVILFNNVQRAGLEDLRMEYRAFHNGKRAYPLDRDWPNTFLKYELRSQNYQNDRLYYDRANFKYVTKRDMDIRFVFLDNATKNCWIDNCDFIDSASAGITFGGKKGSHITIRNCTVDGAFQKGSNGHGYGINCSASYVLMTGNTVKRTRHWAIQQGAQYCVVYKNRSEVDMNFHQGDRGSNLIEDNVLHLPHWQLWKIFQTGASFHGDPGTSNMFYNNDAKKGTKSEYTNKNIIYTFVGRDVVPLPSKTFPPKHGVLYAMKRSNGNPPPPPTPTPTPTSNQKPVVSFKTPATNSVIKVGGVGLFEVNASDKDGSIRNVRLYVNNTFVRQENHAPYEWNAKNQNDPSLKNLKPGTYTIKAIATDNKGATGERSIRITVLGDTSPTPPVPTTTANIPEGVYYLEVPGSGKQRILARNAEKHSARMHDFRDSRDQKWILKKNGNNSYTIQNYSTKRFLEVPSGRCSNGSNVATWTAASRDHQKWQITTSANGGYILKPLHCLDLALDRQEGKKNANVQIWKYSPSSANQIWNIVPVPGAKQESVSITVYPNPATDLITVTGLEIGDSITIYDLYGKTVAQKIAKEVTLLVDTNMFASGMYILSVSDKQQVKLIVE